MDDQRGAADATFRCRRSTLGQVWFSLGGFVAFYTALLVVEIYLMLKYARLGPSCLGTGRYHYEAGTVMIYVFDYATLKVIWWALVGAAARRLRDPRRLRPRRRASLLPFVGRSDDERRVVLNSVGPTWEGNQVWFITAGGATFAAWPLVYATAFSGFYIALILMLFALFLRPVGFDYRSKVADPRWRSAWDWGLFVGGVGAGARLRRRVRQPARSACRSISTATSASFYTGSFVGLLNPFGARSRALVSVAMLAMHGGFYLQLRTDGAVQARAIRAARIAGVVFLVAFAGGGLLDRHRHRRLPDRHDAAADSAFVPSAKTVERLPGGWLHNYAKHPWTIAAPLAAFGATLLRARRFVAAPRGSRVRAVLRRRRRRRADRGVRAVSVHHAVVQRSRRAASRSGMRCRATARCR